MTEIVREPLIADDPPTPQFVDMINESCSPIPVAETIRPTENGRPMTAATSASRRAPSESWPSRARSTARIVGVSTA